MRILRFALPALAVLALVVVVLPSATTARGRLAPLSAAGEIVDLGVRPGAVSVAAIPGPAPAYALAYDDRLAPDALRFAVHTQAGWTTSVVADVLDGRRVGRDPTLAISPTGLRLVAFRSDLDLRTGWPSDGELYAARSFAGVPWQVQRIDADGFGMAAAFDREGRPAIAYLDRTDTGDGADVRLARLENGAWSVRTLERTTFRTARFGAFTSSVGLGFDTQDQPWVAYADPGTSSLRIVTPGAPSRRIGTVPPGTARVAIAFDARGAAAVATGGLPGDSLPLRVAWRRAPGRWRLELAAGSGATAPVILGFRHRRPIVAFRDASGVKLATPRRVPGADGRWYGVRHLLRQRYGAAAMFDGSVGVARVGRGYGLATVAPRGLLVFHAGTLGLPALSSARDGGVAVPDGGPRHATTTRVATATPRPASRDWATWGDGPSRAGRAVASQLTAAAAPRLTRAWSAHVDGLVDAQPLYATGVDVRGHRRSLYLVATEEGWIYAFDARDGHRLWSRFLAVTQTRCAQIPGGRFGITGSPTYDASRGAVYVATSNRLWALDVRSGRALPGWPVALPLVAAKEHVWGALAQRGPFVYAVTASYCDVQPYKGKVIRVDVRSRAVAQWVAVPTPGPNGGGGIWGWGGASIDPRTGHVWVATGNAIGPDVVGEAADDAEAVVELSVGLARLRASKAPGVPAHGDYDFGATPILFAPSGCPPLVAALDKNGSLYLWRRGQLAGGPYQRLQLALPATLFGVPAWDPATRQLFVTTTAGFDGVPPGLHALRVDGRCRARPAWTRPLAESLSSAPVVAGDVVLVGTGSGHLKVFATADGRRLFDAPLGSSDAPSPAFAAPIAVGRDVAIASWNRELDVFRLQRPHAAG